jgi:hypothetical protein
VQADPKEPRCQDRLVARGATIADEIRDTPEQPTPTTKSHKFLDAIATQFARANATSGAAPGVNRGVSIL